MIFIGRASPLTYTDPLALRLTRPHSITISLSSTPTHSYPFSVIVRQIYTQSYSHSAQTHTQPRCYSEQTHTHTQTHTPIRSHTDLLILRRAHTEIHSHSDSLARRFIHSQTCSHSDAPIHRRTRTQTHSLALHPKQTPSHKDSHPPLNLNRCSCGVLPSV